MSATVKGTANAAAATSIAIPTHAIGDLIIIFAYRDGSNTVPSKPAASGTVPAWSDIDAATGANTNSHRSAYFVATATNHTSGTWTSATGMIAVVVQGQASSPIGGHAVGSGSTANLATAPSITQQQTTGKALILEFYGHRTVTAWSSAPSGYTRQASVSTEVALNTKDSSTSDGSITQVNTATASGWRGQTIEILAPDTSPTVALNSPSNTGTVNTTTPTLTFTGTDSEGDPVTYEIQIDTANTFDSGSPVETIDQQNLSGSIGIGFGDTLNGRDYMVQGFCPTLATISAVAFYVNSKDGNTDIGYAMWIDNADASGNPTGTVGVGIGGFTEITNASLNTSGLTRYALASPVTVTPGGKYVVCFAPWNTTTHVWASSYHDWVSSTGNPYAPAGFTAAKRKHLDGSFSNPSDPDSGNDDILFTIYGTTPGALIDKVSASDAGFADITNGAHSDPFVSGEQIGYTLQTALSNGVTYYWRVKGKDPAGTNVYGSWATTQSFSVSLGGRIPRMGFIDHM